MMVNIDLLTYLLEFMDLDPTQLYGRFMHVRF